VLVALFAHQGRERSQIHRQEQTHRFVAKRRKSMKSIHGLYAVSGVKPLIGMGSRAFLTQKRSLNVRTTRLGRPRKHTARGMTSASLIPARQNPARRTDRCRSSADTVAATAPRLTFVTIAKRPSHRGRMRDRTYFLIKRKKNFWTRRAEWKDEAASTGEISAWTQEIR
jgi:hypothetical protein